MCHAHDRIAAPQHGIEEDGVVVRLPTGEDLPGQLYRTGGAGCGPVLLVPDIYGPTPFYRSLARRLATEGFPTLLIDYFFRQGPLPEPTREAAMARRERLDEIDALADVGHAVQWLARYRQRDSDRIALLGFCLGGTLGMDLAAEREDLAVVSYYGFPKSMPGPRAAPRPIDLVDRIRGPLLAFWGERDELIDMADVREFSALAEANPVEYEWVCYPAAGHGFLRGLADDDVDRQAAVDSWSRTLAFLRSRVTPAP